MADLLAPCAVCGGRGGDPASLKPPDLRRCVGCGLRYREPEAVRTVVGWLVAIFADIGLDVSDGVVLEFRPEAGEVVARCARGRMSVRALEVFLNEDQASVVAAARSFKAALNAATSGGGE